MPRQNDILIIEDDSEVSFVFELLLADEGFQVSVAPNGLVAMEFVDNHQPDLILLDLHMPIMDGETFAARYRDEYGAGTPIIVITAVPPPALEERIENAIVLKKPVEIDDLLDTIDHLLVSRNSHLSSPSSFC